MKKRILFALSAVLLSAGAFAQTVDEVVNKHIVAVGGMDKISGIKSVQYEQTMSVMGMEMTGKTTAVVGKSSRSDITVMGQNMVTVIDGESGWMINPMAGSSDPQPIPAEQAKFQKSNTEVTGLQLAYAKINKYPMELVGKEQLNGKDVFNIKVTRPEATVNFYINAGDYQLAGTKAVVPVQGQTAEVKANFSNFKAVEGVTLPFSITMEAPGAPAPINMQVTKLTLNPTVDPAIFKMPAK
ncbi:DUF4292 domain-containing protein [Tellurirhabdus rosea]|uniref:DUF4292 domain-containing protein n=1 Tax=Tellurirhabdus rosea TaxID=2674997 RepID=UPI00224D7F55|nr:DUF4292 domain-containing protein [Tellurirhabdus rosea]